MVKKLYKYTKYRSKLFSNLLFRFTAPSMLNDPFEGQLDKQEIIEKVNKQTWKDEEARKDFLKKSQQKIFIMMISVFFVYRKVNIII